MRIIPFVLALIAILSSTSAPDYSFAEDIITSFYDNLKVLAHGEEGDASYLAGESCIHMAASSEAGLYFPNEFKQFGIMGSHEEESLICSSYISQFKRMAASRHLQFSYQIKMTIPFYEAEWKKTDDEASFVYCIVEKRYGPTVYNGIIRDTVLINGDRKIIGIRNFAGGEAYTGYHNQIIVSNNSSGQVIPNKVNLENLHFSAARYYNQKKYAEAYKTYQDILKYDSSNANAYYRLALMSYRRQGCKQYTKKHTDELAMTYIKKAFDNGDSRLKGKINNILYYW